MRGSCLLILFSISGAILVFTSAPTAAQVAADRHGSGEQPLRMASDNLVVKSYKEVDPDAPSASSVTVSQDDGTEYQIYQGVMGRPGIDFPVYPHIPATNFNCRDIKHSGYYADLSTDCQVFHICDGGRKISFLCPNGTIFRQSHLICDWWFRVDCGKSVELYEESAEQLAADQKVYKAQAHERDRRRKLTKKTFGETEDELIGSEVYALDEPFDVHNRKQQTVTNNHAPSPTQASVSVVTSVRFHEERRSGERHSKKVIDSKMEEKFPSYSRVGKSDRGSEQFGEVFGGGGGSRRGSEVQFVQGGHTGQGGRSRDVPSSTTIHPVFVHKSRFLGRNSIGATQDKEIIPDTATANNPQPSTVQQTYVTHPPLYTFENRRATPDPFSVERETHPPPQFRVFAESKQVTTTPKVEKERQHLAETASFASNRGGRTFSNFPVHNQFEHFNQYKPTPATERSTTWFTTESNTPLLIQVTDASTKVKKPDERFKITQSYSTSPVYKATVPIVTTTPRHIPKVHSKKVTIPTSLPSTTLSRLTTINEIAIERLRNATKRIPVEDIYFTTSSPETEPTTETHTTIPRNITNPEVVLSLQELNIHKATEQPNETTKIAYENVYRDGLAVPPSSGPAALRSFALYFAGSDDLSDRRGKAIPFISKDVLIIPITKNIERKLNRFTSESKTKAVVNKVEEIVKEGVTASTVVSVEKNHQQLPSALTNQTKQSYSALFNQNNATAEMSDRADTSAATEIGTTAFESYTEQPGRINSELSKNDLQGSQSRGIVESDHSNQLNDQFSRVSPDLRELAQVFTKALSAYLDDPEAFRKVLAEIRPTEPSSLAEESSPNPIEYPSATQEDDEVLDFSDVTKASYRKKSSTTSGFTETTTEYVTETPTTLSNEIENLVLPLSVSDNKLNIPSSDLTAPLESLDESQSSYYTPSPYIVGTTNAIAEEINQEFSPDEKLPDIESNEAVDTYFPVTGSVDDQSRPRYGGFQNNTLLTSKYSPYGAELTTTVRQEQTTIFPETYTTPDYFEKITTFNPKNNSATHDFLKLDEAITNQTAEELALAKELNNLQVSATTSRGKYRGSKSYSSKEVTEAALPLHNSIARSTLTNRPPTTTTPVSEFQSVRLGNGETLERTYSRSRARVTQSPAQQQETQPEEINLELSPPFNTDLPKGFLITYALEQGKTTQATYLPRRETTTYPSDVTETTTQNIPTTERLTTLVEQSETLLPTTYTPTEFLASKFTRATRLLPTTTEEIITTSAPSTPALKPRGSVKAPKSLERLMELQETLMFNSHNITVQQKETARVTVEQTMSNMTMTDSTATTLMKMMEMAAKNETYRRLVLLLVNDKSGKNKTVEEARRSLLKALLTPVIGGRGRTRRPQHEGLRTESTSNSLDSKRRTNFRRYKSVSVVRAEAPINRITTAGPGQTTPWKTTRTAPRIVKTTEAPTTTTEKPSTVFGSLGIIRKTIEESKMKDVRVNSLDDAILDSDSRAVELLRSLYSLAARWG